MTDCPLEQRNGKWVCPQCGWSYHKQARRNCPKAGEAMIAEFDRLMELGDEDGAGEVANRLLCWEKKQRPRKITRPEIEKMIAVHVQAGRNTQTPEQMAATLDRCFGGCKQFTGKACGIYGSSCRHMEHWIARLILNGCDEEETK